MKNSLPIKVIQTSLIFILLLSVMTGYSQKKAAANLPAGTVKVQYNYPADKIYKYLTTTAVVQNMDVNGQTMLVNVASYMACNLKLLSKEGQNLKLEIEIDSMGSKIDSPQGITGGDVTDARGRVFNMSVSPSGKPVDLSEAAKIILNVPGSGPSDASQTFLDFFPVLPKNPVKPGDTWITHDTTNTKTSSMSRYMPAESDCKYEGMEQYNGFDCAKITAVISGSMKMTNQAQGMDVSTSGNFTGKRTLLFSLKDGCFIKETIVTKMTGTVEISNQGMSFPVVMDITATNEMVK